MYMPLRYWEWYCQIKPGEDGKKKERGGKKERKEKKWSENLNKIDNGGLSKAKTEIYTFSLNNSVTILGEELLLPKFE